MFEVSGVGLWLLGEAGMRKTMCGTQQSHVVLNSEVWVMWMGYMVVLWHRITMLGVVAERPKEFTAGAGLPPSFGKG